MSKDTLGANTGAGGAGEPGGVSLHGDGSSTVPGFGGSSMSRVASEAETTMTNMAGTQGFMAPEVYIDDIFPFFSQFQY